MKVVVKVNAGTPALAKRTVVLTATSVSEPSRVDVVRAITRH